MRIKKIFALSLLLSCACGQKSAEPVKPAAESPVPAAGLPGAQGLALLPPEGDKAALPDGGWFIWRFAEKPKMGTAIVKVQVFDKDGARVKPYDFIGEFGMPSMRYHDSGPVAFKLSKKGDYLLPVDLVMPGEWEVVIRVKHAKEEIYAGKVLFTI